MTNSVKTIALIGSLEDTDAFARHHIGVVNRRVPPVTLVPTNGAVSTVSTSGWPNDACRGLEHVGDQGSKTGNTGCYTLIMCKICGPRSSALIKANIPITKDDRTC